MSKNWNGLRHIDAHFLNGTPWLFTRTSRCWRGACGTLYRNCADLPLFSRGARAFITIIAAFSAMQDEERV